jgi:biopolymer transport protein TolQ
VLPPAIPSSGGFLAPFLHAGIFAQCVVIVLASMSVATWAVVIRKFRTLGRASRQTRQFLGTWGFRTRLGDYETVARQLRHSPLSSLLLAGVKEFDALRTEFGKSEAGPELLQHMIPNITEAMERVASREVAKIEGSLSFLSITTMVAPFMGLLGTVQGVLVTFMTLRGTQIPTLQSIAPGISDALITAVTGLVVAIPAALFYNYFVGRAHDIEGDMERFESELTGIMRREIVVSQVEQRKGQ